MEDVQDGQGTCATCQQVIAAGEIKVTLRLERDGVGETEVTFGSITCLEKWIASKQIGVGGARTDN